MITEKDYDDDNPESGVCKYCNEKIDTGLSIQYKLYIELLDQNEMELRHACERNDCKVSLAVNGFYEVKSDDYMNFLLLGNTLAEKQIAYRPGY